MKSAAEFYTNRHGAEKGYSGAVYYMKSLWAARELEKWARENKGDPIRLLDVGCGKGVFLRDFVQGLKSRWDIQPASITGVDIVRSSENVFDEISSQMCFVEMNLDGNALPLEDNSFDFISCNHVLEHIFETEKLVKEFRRVLAPRGLCIIAVPNIAAWMNRITFFLWGNQPLGSELGVETVTYGFRPSFLKKRLEAFRASGHIRDFTPRGLQDLTEHCGFQTVGWWSQSFGLVARLGKWSARNMAIILRPKK